ncbi:MAG: von Willebrand factor type A domain-containing protein [Planctomycetota bacterium]
MSNNNLGKIQTREKIEQNASSSSASNRFYGYFLDSRLRQSPWLCFSLLVHGFVVFLLSFITASIYLDDQEDFQDVVASSELIATPWFEELKIPAVPIRCTLESKHDTPSTDPISVDPSDIVVPPDILAQAELGDHWETIQPDQPDTHSAFGNPETYMFHSVRGSDESVGGGNTGGVGLETIIGIGGVRIGIGNGGGWGGGHGTGIGIGSGVGRGSFGSRNGGGRRLMVKRHGGSRAGENGPQLKTRYQQPLGADGALCWLAQHQSPDGRWDCRQYKGKDNDAAVTGLALLAFLRAGQTENTGHYQENVRRAVEWLKSCQRDNGMIADDLEKPGYAHAIAALSLTEAAGASKNTETLKAAEKALQWSCSTEQTSNPANAWRYAGRTGDGDLSVTGWYLLQLSAARQAGLKVSDIHFSNAEKFLKSVTSKNASGETIYRYRPGGDTNPRLNVIGNLCQQLVGAKSATLDSDVKQMASLSRTLNDRMNPDLYYWYYGGLCCYQQGGDAWQNWYSAMKSNLLGSQNRTGMLGGSWDPKGPFSEHWGRVGQTALGALCLEVFNRAATVSGNAVVAEPEVKVAEVKPLKETKEAKEAITNEQLVVEDVPNAESYELLVEQGFTPAQGDSALSTFAIDVDTASYSNVRRILNEGKRPPKGAVRIEEMINYFPYNYAPPTDGQAFAVHGEIADCPWNPEHRMALVCLKGRDIPWDQRPSSNLVFLIDVSGSMSSANKLPLVQTTLKLLVDRLSSRDKVAIVVYASATGLTLRSTICDRKNEIKLAIDSLSAGGSTNGAGGIQEAYRVATENFITGGTNRVILCTDGDFNVGISDKEQLFQLIQDKAKSGVFLSVMGFGMGNLKDDMLEGLADKGNGNYGYIDSEKEAKKLLVDQIGSTLITIAKDVKIQVEFNPMIVAFYRLVGYENRLMAAADFRNDKKDAGEIGAGHTVTALYEIVPCDSAAQAGAGTQPLKYQKDWEFTPLATSSGELFTVFVRHKAPDAETATEINIPFKDQNRLWKDAGENYRWAAAVAMFGMQLRGSTHKGKCDWALIEKTAREAMTSDPGGYRAEFLQLLNKASKLSPATPTVENTAGEF